MQNDTPRTRAERDKLAKKLIGQYLDGDAEAMGKLFRLYYKEVYKILYSILRDDPEIEDLVQDSFVQLIRSVHSFEFRSSFSSWLYRVVANVAYMHLRSKKREPVKEPVPEELSDTNTSITKDAEHAIFREQALEILERLSPKKSEVFILYEFAGYELKEIAQMLGISLSNVKSRLHFARKEFYAAWMRKLRSSGEYSSGIAPTTAEDPD